MPANIVAPVTSKLWYAWSVVNDVLQTLPKGHPSTDLVMDARTMIELAQIEARNAGETDAN